MLTALSVIPNCWLLVPQRHRRPPAQMSESSDWRRSTETLYKSNNNGSSRGLGIRQKTTDQWPRRLTTTIKTTDQVVLIVVVSRRGQSFFASGVYILWWLCTHIYWDIWLGKNAVNVWTNVRGWVEHAVVGHLWARTTVRDWLTGRACLPSPPSGPGWVGS